MNRGLQKQEGIPPIRGVDVEAGLSMTGRSTGQYVEILQEFGSNMMKKAEDIERYYEERDWQNYVISVHALKSTAKVIGAMALSDMAYALEMAGKQGDVQQILQNTRQMVEEYRKIGADIRRIFPREETQTRDWDQDAVTGLLQELTEAAADFDYFRAEELAEELSVFSFGRMEGGVMEELRKKIDEMDYFGMRDAAVRLLALTEEKGKGRKMEKRVLEKSGIETSLLGFGCMRFPVTADGKIDEATAEKMLDTAIASGVNYIDTAYPYHNGESEPFVGKVLQKYDRSSFYLATKLPAWMIKSREQAEKIFKEQLERLQTDYIDFYLLHAMNMERWEAMNSLGVVELCEQFKREGKIRNFGFSFHDGYEAFEEILCARDWDFCQIQLNYMDTEEQAGLKGYRLAEERKVPLVIMEPIKGGSLAAFSEDITVRLEKVRPGASTASFALRWVGSLPNVKVVLSGMSTMVQVEDNLKTFKDFQPLTEEEQQKIAEITETLNSRVQNGCTGCRYCMPCPAGVNIPRNFNVWNTYHMYQNYNVVRWEWEHDMPREQKAANCIECGKCEAVCPQKLHIRGDLKKAQADLDKKEMIL